MRQSRHVPVRRAHVQNTWCSLCAVACALLLVAHAESRAQNSQSQKPALSGSSSRQQAAQQAPTGYQPPPGGQAPAGYRPPPGGPGSMERPKVVGKGYIKFSYVGDDSLPEAEEGTLNMPAGPTVEQETYIIKDGDCLWNLSGKFLSDVWRWREIWDRNKYIANPDLIYPGNELVMDEHVVQPPPLIDSTFLQNPKDFGDATAGFLDDTMVVNQDSIDLAQKEEEELAYLNAIVKKKILTQEFLASTPFLWRKPDPRGLIYPGDARIDPKSERESFQQFDEVSIRPFGDSEYRVGDTVTIFRSERRLTYKEKKANLVRRIARARVTAVDGKTVRAELFKVRDVVKRGDRVAHADVFPRISVLDYVRAEAGVVGEVFERVEQTLFPYLYHTFILDRGSADGVQMGDIFLVYAQEEGELPRATQAACAVHVEDDYATLATVKLYESTLSDGDKVNLVMRMRKDQ